MPLCTCICQTLTSTYVDRHIGATPVPKICKITYWTLATLLLHPQWSMEPNRTKPNREYTTAPPLKQRIHDFNAALDNSERGNYPRSASTSQHSDAPRQGSCPLWGDKSALFDVSIHAVPLSSKDKKLTFESTYGNSNYREASTQKLTITMTMVRQKRNENTGILKNLPILLFQVLRADVQTYPAYFHVSNRVGSSTFNFGHVDSGLRDNIRASDICRVHWNVREYFLSDIASRQWSRQSCTAKVQGFSNRQWRRNLHGWQLVAAMTDSSIARRWKSENPFVYCLMLTITYMFIERKFLNYACVHKRLHP